MTKRTALYRHFDATGKLLYIGISLSAVHRLKQHTIDKAWADDIASMTVEQYGSREEALEAERDAIIAEKPLWNVMHNKKSEPVNLWQVAFDELRAAGKLYDSSEEAEAAWKAEREAFRENFMLENPGIKWIV